MLGDHDVGGLGPHQGFQHRDTLRSPLLGDRRPRLVEQIAKIDALHPHGGQLHETIGRSRRLCRRHPAACQCHLEPGLGERRRQVACPDQMAAAEQMRDRDQDIFHWPAAIASSSIAFNFAIPASAEKSCITLR